MPAQDAVVGKEKEMARIYIADDDADTRNVLVFSLTERGHEVLAAHHGRELVDAVVESTPDLIVLDLGMPEMDGYGVLARLEEYGLREAVKVLVVTARNSEKDRAEVLQLGSDGFLSKPFEPTSFVEAVDDLLLSSSEELEVRKQEDEDVASLLARLEAMLGSDGVKGAERSQEGPSD